MTTRKEEHRERAAMTLGAYCLPGPEMVALLDEIEQLRAALGELLSGHDNLYIAHFGPNSNPHDDIAAKPARAALEPEP